MLKHLTVAQVKQVIDAAEALANKYPPSKSGINIVDPSTLDQMAAYEADSKILEGVISSLGSDALKELKALMWLGRGDFDDFADALAEASDNTGDHDAEYIAEKSPLPTYLREGLQELGLKLP